MEQLEVEVVELSQMLGRGASGGLAVEEVG